MSVRVVDRKSLYNPDVVGPELRETLWWPTNGIACKLAAQDASHVEREQSQFTLYVAVCAFVSMMLFQIGWSEPAALGAWSGGCTLTLMIAYVVGAAKESPAPLRWWVVILTAIFPFVNFLATGCRPVEYQGGRYYVMLLFGVAPLIGMGATTSTMWAVSATNAALYVAVSVLEGVEVSCYDASSSSVNGIVVVLLQLVLPAMLLCTIIFNVARNAALAEHKLGESELFAKACVRHALQGDVDALVKAVQAFDDTATLLPSMSDDALSVVIDLLQKTAKGVEEARAKKPGSRSPGSQTGLLNVPATNNSASSDDEGASSGRRRRSSARLLSLEPNTTVLPPFPVPEKGLMVLSALCLPNARKYVDHPNANVDLAKLFMTEFVDNCRSAAGRYGGVVCFSSFETIYAKFPDVQSAVAACVCLQDYMKKVRGHHPDVAVRDTRVLYPFCIVLQSHAMFGTYGTGLQVQTSTVGFADSEAVFQRILDMRQTNSAFHKTGIVVPSSMVAALKANFTLADTSNSELMEVMKSRQEDAEGLPIVAPTGDAVLVHIPQFALPNLQHSMSSSLRNEVSMGSSILGGEKRTPVHRSSKVELPPEALIAWDTYDRDGSGTLDLDEVRAVFQGLGYKMTEEDLQKFFIDADKDGSGSISKSEFAAAFSSPNVGGAAVMDRIGKAGIIIAKSRGGDAMATVLESWQKYDKDSSGSLDYTELALLLADLGMAQSQVELDWLVRKLDRDNSGFVDFEEFSRLFTNDNVTRQVAAKARSQVVTRVVNNKSSGVVFSNADQLLRDSRVELAAVVEKYLTFPFFLYIAYNCGAITFNIAVGSQREPETTANIAVDLVLDIFLVFWVFLKYMYLPREDKGQIAFHRMDVIKHSLKTIDFYFDMIAIIPLDFIYIGLGTPANGGVIAFYRCNKLLLYWYCDECYKTITKSMAPALVRGANAMVYFLSFAHLFACFLIGLARSVGENGDGMSDLIGYDSILSNEVRTYPVALYWAIITLVGQNRSSILPELDSELALLFVAMLVGLPMYAVVLGTIAQAVRVDDSYTKFLDKIDNLRSYFQYTRLPENIENECIAYYRHLYFTTGSLDITENPLEDLPAELSIQVVIQIGQEMLRKVPIFQDASRNSEFVHELTTKLVPEVIPPLTTVMRKGERGTNMYFITFGDFNILADNGMAVFALKKGNFFGEIALLHNVKRTATIQSFGKFANVLSLDKKDFDEVTLTFPDCLSQVYKAAEDRIKQILEREEEEARQAKEKRKQERDAKRRESVLSGAGTKSSSSDEESTHGPRRGSSGLASNLNKSNSNRGKQLRTSVVGS